MTQVIGDTMGDEGSRRDPNKIKTPKLLDDAAEATKNLNLGDYDEAERDRVFQYRAKPALDLFAKQKQATNKYFNQQGLRFSSQRSDKLLEQTDETFRYIGESVMIPQIEREQADIRANIGLQADIGYRRESLDLQGRGMDVQEGQLALSDRIQTGQLKLAEGQLDVQERQQTMQEINSAMERALVQGELTGVYEDPQNPGVTMDTLKKAAQDFGQGIEERQTTILELDAIMARLTARGDATGMYVDPVTGYDIPTLEARRLKYENRVQRAIAIGKWIEDDLDLDLSNVFATLGLRYDDWLGAGGDGGNAGDNEESGDDADSTVDDIWDTEKEITFISQLGTILDGWGLASDEAARDALEAVTAEIGVDAAQELFTRFSNGDLITFGELWNLDPEATRMLWDILVVDVGEDGLGESTGLRVPGVNAQPTVEDEDPGDIGDDGQPLVAAGGLQAAFGPDATQQDMFNFSSRWDMSGGWEGISDDDLRIAAHLSTAGIGPSDFDGAQAEINRRVNEPNVEPTADEKFQRDVLDIVGSSYTSDQINNAKTAYRNAGGGQAGAKAAQDYLRGFKTTTSASSDTGSPPLGDTDESVSWQNTTLGGRTPVDFAKALEIPGGKVTDPNGFDAEVLSAMAQDGRLDLDAIYMLYNQGKITGPIVSHLRDKLGKS